ncbi:acyl carrier protein [Amycolatopsis sp. GM8]|uniref:acyl carrier protein n=1 Tax=Amycolatopsis sp. GM8 TaxID=2896530 RepID=UPI001F27300A|nr:acyl carrier protein [Amycolatopsis sp. GM8]
MTTSVRNQVLAIVKRVLKREEIPENVDFFDLGASSLAVIQIVELVRKECDSEVWITDAFDAADIAAFAELAEQGVRSGASATK